MALTLESKVAIVTGASRGIGAQIAFELAKRGAKAGSLAPTPRTTGLLMDDEGCDHILFLK